MEKAFFMKGSGTNSLLRICPQAGQASTFSIDEKVDKKSSKF